MKKFSFNLKFLDRFKKSSKSKKTDTTETQDLLQKLESTTLSDDITAEQEIPSYESSNIDEDAEEFDLEFDPEELGLECNLEAPEEISEEIPEDIKEEIQVENLDEDTTFKTLPFERATPKETEFADSSDNEQHAESTLTSFDLEKFRKEHAHLENDYSETDITNPNFEFKELNLNHLEEKPASKKRSFSFKMPSFGSKETAQKESSSRKPLEMKDLIKLKSKAKDVTFNDVITYLFSTELRPKIHNVFIICLLVFITYFTGKSAALFLSGSTSTNAKVRSNTNTDMRPTNSSQDINKITSVNLFNLKNSENDQLNTQPNKPKNLICLDSEKPTAEPLKLLDTIVLQDSVKSIASVQMRGQSDLLNVREGEQINNGIEVAKITRLKVILKNMNTGECEYISNFDPMELAQSNLKISPPSKAKNIFSGTNANIKNEGNTFKINTKYRDEMIGNMSEILTQAKAIQLKNPDGSLAFKMTDVVPGSIYSQLNIQNDDVITSINGKKIENLNELMGLLGKIKEIDHFQIGLKRNGVNENLEYNFE